MKRFFSLVIILFVLLVSIFIMISPTFFGNTLTRFEVKKEVKLPLVLDDSRDVKLLFFGYSGCINVCTPRLRDLSTLYETFDESIKKRVGIEFIDISTPDDEMLPQAFATAFHPDFKGIYLNSKVLREYTKAFEVYFSQSLIDKTEFYHTSNLYILKKVNGKKEIRFIYNTYPYNFEQIRRDIMELINE